MDIQRRVALVTAAGGAIGAAIVRELLTQDMEVVAVDLDSAALAALTAEIGCTSLRTIPGDLTDEQDVARIFGTLAPSQPLHVLVNGVGSICDGGIRTLSLADWRQKFDLNLTSVFLATRAALPFLEATAGDRVIINISSTLASVADPTTIAYGAFKAGVEYLTRCLALELAPAGIRSLAIAPGPVASTIGEAAYETPEYMRLNPLGRFATVEEIAALIAFLVSPKATYLTGLTVPVDGGDAALGAGWGPLRRLIDRVE